VARLEFRVQSRFHYHSGRFASSLDIFAQKEAARFRGPRIRVWIGVG
jgi:hypothetical protein